MEKKYFGKKNEDDRDKGVGGQNNGLNDGQSNRQEEQESINFDAVSLNFFGSSEPIIVFFGPPGVGKTVAFFRLMRRLEEEAGYKFTVSNATPDEGPFLAAKEAFRSSMATMDKETPPRTSNLDFLLVNASEHGSLKWHFLEAPGEHFFGATKPTDNRFKRYLSEVFATPNKKVYIFFFEHNMFGNPADRNKYAQRVANFINTRAKLGRDQFIILFNKINDHPQLFGGGEVNRDVIKNEIWQSRDYSPLQNALRDNGDAIGYIPTIPFYSGDFYEEHDSWTMSDEKYPNELFAAINESLHRKAKKPKTPGVKKRGWKLW
jgi:hypothetical protein